MIKVRLMGTKNDIKWFQKILERDQKFEVTEFSELYTNKGTLKYYRAYVEILRKNEKNTNGIGEYNHVQNNSYSKSKGRGWKDHNNWKSRNRYGKRR
jgi:hypothetical protein